MNGGERGTKCQWRQLGLRGIWLARADSPEQNLISADHTAPVKIKLIRSRSPFNSQGEFISSRWLRTKSQSVVHYARALLNRHRASYLIFMCSCSRSLCNPFWVRLNCNLASISHPWPLSHMYLTPEYIFFLRAIDMYTHTHIQAEVLNQAFAPSYSIDRPTISENIYGFGHRHREWTRSQYLWLSPAFSRTYIFLRGPIWLAGLRLLRSDTYLLAKSFGHQIFFLKGAAKKKNTEATTLIFFKLQPKNNWQHRKGPFLWLGDN